MLGDMLLLTVIALQIATGDQPWRLTVVYIAFAVPLFALAPVAGRIVDEFDSRRVLLIAGLVQAGAAAWIAVSGTFPMLVAAVVMLQAGQAVSGPAWSALLPKIVGNDAVGKATGNLSAAGAVAGMAGAALGGVLYDPLGFRGAVLINAAGFVAIAVAGVLVRTRRGRRYLERDAVRSPADVAAASHRTRRDGRADDRDGRCHPGRGRVAGSGCCRAGRSGRPDRRARRADELAKDAVERARGRRLARPTARQGREPESERRRRRRTVRDPAGGSSAVETRCSRCCCPRCGRWWWRVRR